MFQDIWAALSSALGLEVDTNELNALHMSLRALIVFVVAIGMVRLGNKRFMGRSTALDVILVIVFGSILSRAITGNAPFFPALAASLTLVLLHWLLSALAFHSRRFGVLVKGHERTLIRDGEIQWDAMKGSHISEHDLHEALRINGKTSDLQEVKSAHLERNGDISVVLREQG